MILVIHTVGTDHTGDQNISFFMDNSTFIPFPTRVEAEQSGSGRRVEGVSLRAKRSF